MGKKSGIMKFLMSVKGILLGAAITLIGALTGAFFDVQTLKAEVKEQKGIQSIISTDLTQVKEDVSFIKGWVEAQ